jgi:hypothetical protein
MNIVCNHPINFFSALGLLLDFIGVLILFKYGLPSKIKTLDNCLDAGDLTDAEKEQILLMNRKITIWAKWGLGMIILGFALQFAGVIFRTI